ncbi:MAG: DegV family protein [Clostridia bacterium]|nr:DegV family protein [Clostridia bacterium]
MENRKFDIVTDSGCDMPAEYLEKHGVSCAKLGFTMNNINYEGEGGEHISEKDFYAQLRAGSMPTTYQVTGEMARQHIEKSLKVGRDVLVIAFSGGLSGTAGSFIVAARQLSEEYPDRKIRVIDSLCASMGQGLLLHYAVQKADSGASIDETYEYAEALKLKICHHFTVDNLFHLKRGGRVSTASAIIGSMLKIKPVMHVDNEGKLTVLSKVMGRKKSLATLVENLFACADMNETDPIFISHGDCIEDVEYVKTLIRDRLPNVEIYVHYVGTVIGTHSGAGTVALFNKGKQR